MDKINKIILIILIFLLAQTAGCSTDYYEYEPEPESALTVSYQADEDIFDYDNYLTFSEYIIIAFYTIENGELGQPQFPLIDENLYLLYSDEIDYSLEELTELQDDIYLAGLLWEAVQGLIPEPYFGQILYFEIFTDGVDDYLGAVESIEEGDSGFIFSLDINDMFDDNMEIKRDLLFETITHELGHLITLGPDEVIWLEEEDANPQTYYVYEYDLDTYPTAYLNLFFQEFWADIYDEWSNFYYEYGVLYEGQEALAAEYDEILQTYLEDFHDTHSNRFVAEYAATSPVEDIAETFMIFVLQDAPEGDSISEEKIRFFYRFPELIEVREHVQLYLHDRSEFF